MVLREALKELHIFPAVKERREEERETLLGTGGKNYSGISPKCSL